MKAISTKYKGIMFRSRIEARWAVFFEAVGLKWEYEQEGYILQSGECYLPDFVVHSPEFGPIFIEIKPDRAPEPKEILKCKQVSTKYKTLLIHGNPYVDFYGFIDAPFLFFCSGIQHDKTSHTLADWLDIDRDTFPLECFTEARFEHGQVPNTTRPVQFIKIVDNNNCPRYVQGKELTAVDLVAIKVYTDLLSARDEAPKWFPAIDKQ